MHRIRHLLPIAIIAALSLLSLATANELRIGMNGADVNQLDPVKSTQTQDVVIMDAIFSGLVRFEPGNANPGDIQPELATDWEASDDGLTWTFHLREGVQFHHGYGEMTAEDVVFSLRRASDPDASAFASDYEAFESVEALGPYTVEITLAQQVPSLLGLVANYHGGLIVSKDAVEELGDDFALNPVGTGPFSFADYEAQQFVRLEAFQDHFRGDPALEGVVFRFLPNTQSRQLAFETDELDIVYGRRDQLWVDEVSQLDEVTVDIIGLGETRLLHFNMTREPLDDVKIRQAIAHAINKAEIQAFLGEDIALLEPSPVPAGYEGHVDDVASYPYDPERAQELLEEAGHPDGFNLGSVLITETASLRVPMEILQEQLAQVGIDFELEVIDHATWHERIREDASPMVLYGAARFPVADIYLNQFFASDSIVGTPTAVTNFSHYGEVIPGIDEQLDQAATAGADQQARLDAWAEAQHKIMEDLPAYPLYTLQLVMARKNRVDLGYDIESSMTLFYPITADVSLQ